MTQVKVCGIRDREIAARLHAAEWKPAYAGFVFAKSRRQVTMAEAAVLSRILGDEIAKVGVFVDSPYDEIAKITEACDLDVVQLHGQETPELCTQLATSLQIHVWKAVSVKMTVDTTKIQAYQCCVHGMLLDTYDPDAAGGTGKTFDWKMIETYRELTHDLPLIVAGGIREANVQDLIQTYHPDIIDVSSGIEAADGTQDFQKMISLLKRVNNL